MCLNYSNKHQYLQKINCSYIPVLHDCLANLNSSSTILIALILYFVFQKNEGERIKHAVAPKQPNRQMANMLQKARKMLYFIKNIV